jgi:hypothetical protein
MNNYPASPFQSISSAIVFLVVLSLGIISNMVPTLLHEGIVHFYTGVQLLAALVVVVLTMIASATLRAYSVAKALGMALIPVLWGFICSGLLLLSCIAFAEAHASTIPWGVIFGGLSLVAMGMYIRASVAEIRNSFGIPDFVL